MSKYKSQGHFGKKTTKRQNPLLHGLHNDSPVQNKTIAIVNQSSESQVALQVFGDVSKKTCQIYCMITPNCSLHFNKIMAKLQKLNNKYDKKATLMMIQRNMMVHGIGNINNLQAIEDDQFWSITMPKIIQALLIGLPKVEIIKLMLRKSSQIVDISRQDVFMLLASMFIGYMPKQPHQQSVSFGELMQFKETIHSRQLVRRQKLKCMMAYFKIVIRNPKICRQYVRIKRTSSQEQSYLDIYNLDHLVPLRLVTIKQQKQIENYPGKAIMIDFANRRVGRGVLKDQCKREQIMFCSFPQLIITKLLCEQLQDDEALVVYSVRRYVKYKGYDDRFQFQQESPIQKTTIANKSVIVAIDASDYKFNNGLQYTKKGIRRQINKAFAGMQGAIGEDNEDMPICTGKWGFENGSDEDLKFIIQWIASSEANREMIYLTTNTQKVKEYRLLVDQLAHLTTLDLLSIVDQYTQNRSKASYKFMSLLQYIKYNI